MSQITKLGFVTHPNWNLDILIVMLNWKKILSDTESTIFLPKGTNYNFGGGFINYMSTRKTLFNWSAEAAKGTFYSGKIQYILGELGYRVQPYINMSINFNYTDMDLGGSFKHTKLWLVGPKVDVTFTENLFWSTFVQYNEQIDNMNINMRLQWRYQPVSDIFVVYTDNYIPGKLEFKKPGTRAENDVLAELILDTGYWMLVTGY